MTRESWDSYFMRLALMAASRATCKRRKVGAVLVQNKSVKGTGYNGAPSGVPSCIEDDCLMKDGSCIKTVHAETNLILQTDASDRLNATVYCTDRPCWNCSNTLANSKIAKIIYARPYPKDLDLAIELFNFANIELVEYTPITEVDLTLDDINNFLGVPSV